MNTTAGIVRRTPKHKAAPKQYINEDHEEENEEDHNEMGRIRIRPTKKANTRISNSEEDHHDDAEKKRTPAKKRRARAKE